jgi:hypothetical protein
VLRFRLMVKRGPWTLKHQKEKRSMDHFAGLDVSVKDATPVARPGDVWLLGRHRLLCADARDSTSYQALMGDERAHLMFTDPPYNVPIMGHVCGLGRSRHREFAMAATRHLLFAVIAYRLQVDRFGDLDHATKQVLDRAVARGCR